MLLLKVTEVTTEDQKWPEIGQHSIKSPFLPNCMFMKLVKSKHMKTK